MAGLVYGKPTQAPCLPKPILEVSIDDAQECKPVQTVLTCDQAREEGWPNVYQCTPPVFADLIVVVAPQSVSYASASAVGSGGGFGFGGGGPGGGSAIVNVSQTQSQTQSQWQTQWQFQTVKPWEPPVTPIPLPAAGVVLASAMVAAVLWGVLKR